MLPLPTQPIHVAISSRWLGSQVHFPFYLSFLPSHKYNRSFRAFCDKSRNNLDKRSRLSGLWAPSGGIAAGADEDAHSKLIRAGFIRQAHSGIFHMLPLGHRVQKKIECLIDRHMHSLGASRLDLSSISSESLWRKSGRLSKANSELFRFNDRRDIQYLLSPTHEEEITDLVANTVKSYKDLPSRLYQISRKYRDELRPRHGLLRSREFVMKDLYTFDYNTSLALATYDQVRVAYAALFDELKIPYLIARADSGDMGGNLSHEFQFLTSKGEDHVIICHNCSYIANEELAQAALPKNVDPQDRRDWIFVPHGERMSSTELVSKKAFSVWRGLSVDRSTLVNVWYPLVPSASAEPLAHFTKTEVNIHAVKSLFPHLDPGVENAEVLWGQMLKDNKTKSRDKPPIIPKMVNLVDCRIPITVLDAIHPGDLGLSSFPSSINTLDTKVATSVISSDPVSREPLNLLRIQNGDSCPQCRDGRLKVQTAIELGHTFFLGTRYSEPLNAVVTVPADLLETEKPANSKSPRSERVPMQMGCHGIGVSRMIGAVADTLVDAKGLNWPRVIAPYEAVVVPAQGNEHNAVTVYDALTESRSHNGESLDVVLDDRAYPFAWKMRDADLVGYPVIVVVGKGWKNKKTCEVQCRRLRIHEDVSFEGLSAFLQKLLLNL